MRVADHALPGDRSVCAEEFEEGGLWLHNRDSVSAEVRELTEEVGDCAGAVRTRT